MSKQQVIIIEGIDMVGKTSIIRELSKTLNIPAYKEIREEKWYDHNIDLLYAEEARIQMLEQIGFSIIFDRSYPSEWAYAHAYERKTIPERILELDKRYATLGTKIIYLYKSPEYFQQDKTNLIDFSKYSRIDERYREFLLFKTKCDYMFLDTSDQNIHSQVESICDFLNIIKEEE
jgi:thymidylate kinase